MSHPPSPRRAGRLLLALVLLVTAGLAALPALAGPAAAAPTPSAGTLVFIKQHDVWIARADGTGQRRLTTTGTAAQPWRSPTQSDTGVIVAGRGHLAYRMDQFGTVLGALDLPDVPNSAGIVQTGAPAHLAVSPDGRRLAYTYEQYSCPPGLACKVRYVTAFTDTGRVTPYTSYGVTYYDNPSWVSNTRVLVNQDLLANLYFHDLRRGDLYWFDDNVHTSDDRTLTDAEISRDRRFLTLVRDTGSRTHIFFYRVVGDVLDLARPPFPERLCSTTEEPGLGVPTWSADGARAAWQEPTGVWAVEMGSAPCETNPYLLVAGASQPSFSAAALRTTRPVYDLRATARPKVAGRARPGRRLTATAGVWSPAPTVVRYQWLRDGRSIRGATKPSRRIVRRDRGHRLSVRVTVSRPGFRTASAVSVPVRVRR